MSGLIQQTGALGWLINPFSYFGLSPLSYPPAVPTDIAAFSDLSGLNLETSILFYTLLLGSTVTWTSFVLGRAAFHRDSLALLLSLLLSTANGVVAFTNWTLTTRGTFLVFVPLALALLLGALSGNRREATLKTETLALCCIALVFVHNLWLLLVPTLALALIILRVTKSEELLLGRGNLSSKAIITSQVLISAGFAALLIQGGGDFFSESNFPVLRSSIVPDSLLTRMGVQYATTMGIGIIALPLGVWRIFGVAERRRRYALSAVVAAFLPIALDPVYGILLSIPVVLIGVTAGLAGASVAPPVVPGRALTRRLLVSALILGVVVAIPYLVTVPRSTGIGCNQPEAIDGRTYDAGLYLKYGTTQANFSFASDDGLDSARLEAISGRPSVEPILSVGTLGYPWLSKQNHVVFAQPTSILNSLITQQQLLTANEWISAASSGYPYFFGKHTSLLLANTPGSATGSAILDAYHTTYAVQICQQSNTTFFNSVAGSSYEVYANNVQRVYLIAR